MWFFSFNNIGHSSRVGLILVSLIFVLGFAPWTHGATYYVDSGNGIDTNAGTEQLPLKSISAALSKAYAGDTILINSGTYRETIQFIRGGSDASHPIVLQAISGSNVQIKGSDLVTGWVKHNGSIWKKPNWNVNSQQVFVDGTPLQQIGVSSPFNTQTSNGDPLLPAIGIGLSSMLPGSFWYDMGEATLYVWLADGSDPRSHEIEASVRDQIIPAADLVDYIYLIGLRFAHSNQTARGSSLGMVNVWGDSWFVSDCQFNYGDFAGIHLIGNNHKILRNTFNYNGAVGININGSDAAHNWEPYQGRPPQNIQLEGNETSYNNYRNFLYNWHAGGIKAIPSCNAVLVSQHKAVANNGHGIWFDTSCMNITINRCIVKNNKAGIFYEISDDAMISNNLVVGNAEQGIYIAASSGSKVFNNTVYKNWAGIVIHGLPRAEHPSLENNTIRNNIISENDLVDLVLYSGSLPSAGNTTDYNLYFRSDGTAKISLTNTPGYDVNYRDYKLFSSATGQEIHSLSADPLWMDSLAGDFSLKPNSPAIDAGQLIDGIGGEDLSGFRRVSGKYGVSPAIDIGAYEFQYGLQSPKGLRIIK